MRTRKIIVEVTEGEHTRWQKSDSAVLLAIERQLGYVFHGATAGTVPSVRASYADDRPDDTRRLDYLLRFMCVDDVGDDTFSPGVVIRSEDLEDTLSHGFADYAGRRPCLDHLSESMRDIIDRSIAAHAKPAAPSQPAPQPPPSTVPAHGSQA